ncbi:sodium:proline symporter, partial [Bacillus subtilis]
FGPLVLMSLYWKGLSKNGAIAGMVTSSIVVLFWIMMKGHGGIFELYEIIPGFLTNVVVTTVVSSFTKKPEKHVIDNLDKMNRILDEK